MLSQFKPRALVSLLFVLNLTAQIAWADPYISPGKIDGVELLGPPPVTGSPESAADLAQSRQVVKNRTPAEEARAFKDASLAFSLFQPIIGPEFKLDTLPRTKLLLDKVKAEIGPFINAPKEHWQRQRPYQVDPTLSVGAPVAGGSYPSGHSSRGTVYAMVLAELFPDKKEAILEMGRQIGWDRVVIGKHFLTDVRAGRVMGQAIFRQLMASPQFQADLRAAKSECAALHEPALVQ